MKRYTKKITIEIVCDHPIKEPKPGHEMIRFRERVADSFNLYSNRKDGISIRLKIGKTQF